MATYKFYTLGGGDWTIQRDSENIIAGSSNAEASAAVRGSRVYVVTFYPYFEAEISLSTNTIEIGGVDVTANGAATIVEQLNETIFTGAAGGDGSSSYLVYTAKGTQDGTNPLVADVIDKTIVGTVVWTRQEAGVYLGTCGGAFPAAKTICPPFGDGVSLIGLFSSLPFDYGYSVSRFSDDVIKVEVYATATGNYAELSTAIGNTHPILIQVQVKQ